jgi:Domain of unknown function (DUF4280)
MSSKAVVVQGAKLKCQFSESPQTDTLKVKTQTKQFANDKDGSKKLIATDKEIGQTLEKNTFGKCTLQPTNSGNLPCQAVITKWSDVYEKVVFEENKGKILLEDSKATCPIGGPDCITVEEHGQKAEASKQQSRQSNDATMTAVNPLADNKNCKEEDELDQQSYAE